MKLREVRPHEYEQVGEMAMNTFLGLPGYCLDKGYETQIRNVEGRHLSSTGTVFVAVEEIEDEESNEKQKDTEGRERILGTITYISGPGPFAEVQDEDTAGMRVLAVAPEARGKGVGKALVDECIRRAKMDPTKKKLFVMTCDWMEAAVKLYEGMGFKRVPERDKVVTELLIALAYQLEV